MPCYLSHTEKTMRIFITFLCWGFFTLAQAQKAPIDLKSSAVAQEPKCIGITKTIQKEGRSDFWQCVDSWVYDHFSYPQEAFDNELDAVVWVPFVIDKKGVMSVNKDSIDINVPYNKKEDLEKGKYKAIKEVSCRIFANFPKVTPAKNTKGKVIAVKGRYPISFEIPKDEDKKPIKGAEGLAKAHEKALAPVIEKRAYRVGKEHLSEEEKIADVNQFFSITIRNKYHYPPAALELGISGTVIVKIVVDKEGKITARAIRGPKELRAGAEKIFTNLPNFVSAIDQYGAPIESTYVIPIKYSFVDE